MTRSVSISLIEPQRGKEGGVRIHRFLYSFCRELQKTLGAKKHTDAEKTDLLKIMFSFSEFTVCRNMLN